MIREYVIPTAFTIVGVLLVLTIMVYNEEPVERTKRQSNTMDSIINNDMLYMQDRRTKLCFAQLSFSNAAIAHVPCTPEVMTRIRLED